MNARVDSPIQQKLEDVGLLLFWCWNAFFVALLLLGFAPLVLPDILRSVASGVTPVRYLVQSLVVISLPVISSLIAILLLRRQPARVFALGYVFEWPLMLIMLFHFVMVRQGNPAINVLLVWLAIAQAIFLWHLLDGRIDQRPAFWRHLRLAGLTLLFAGTLYAAAWLLFYLPIIFRYFYDLASMAIQNFSHMMLTFEWERWYNLPLGILSYILLLFSAVLILMMPLAAPIIAGRAWLHSLRSSLQVSSRLPVLAASALPLALVVAVLMAAMVQPQQRAFRLLESPPEDVARAQYLQQNEELIRAGLRNAYLARFRYFSSLGEVRHIRDLYQYSFGLSPENALRVERVYEQVIRPFLYTPAMASSREQADNQVFNRESNEAALLYQRFFDRPIVDGERGQVVNAVRSNFDTQQAEAAWQVVDQRMVHLNRQDVRLTEHGDWAEIEIHEVYENQTTQRQEVVYYFSLPESAVVTGLWLGNSPDREVAFRHQVAPRGAAQSVYQNEVRYMRDPALLEQMGPRQYRLRIFPIEPQSWINSSHKLREGPELHLWMTYTTPAVGGDWPLPRLAEKRNVYWDRQTVRVINGERRELSDSGWLPAALPASSPVVPALHAVKLSSGHTVLARPAAQDAAAMPAGLRLAVVLDRSGSMSDRSAEVAQAVASLQERFAAGPEPELYLTASAYRGERPAKAGLMQIDPNQVFYFGGQNAAELIAQFQELQAGETHDLVLVLTDGSGYELGLGDVKLAVPDAPLWVVHLGGGFPLGYDDATQQAIQASGGGVAATVDEALARYAASLEAPGSLAWVDGYLWQTFRPGQEATLPGEFVNDPGFAPLAARQAILAEMAANSGSLDQLLVLDELHRLAVEQSIVTPYSSMIVLVNQAQEKMLEERSEWDDRFEREVESVGLTNEASPFGITGVPEPEEWLLIISACLLLLYGAWRKLARKTVSPLRLGAP